MTLTPRQRTKINAALCLLDDNGYDAQTVIHMATQLNKDGKDHRTAYETALNAYLAEEPDIFPAISKALRLVDASDDATVDQYDAALSVYATTGDDSSLNALAPMIAQDSLALALREGEITQEEAAGHNLKKALGFEPGPALQEAVTAMAQQSSDQQASQPQQAQQWRQPDQMPVTQVGKAPAPSHLNGSQVSVSGPTGYVAPRARAAWARETLQPGSQGYPTGDAQGV